MPRMPTGGEKKSNAANPQGAGPAVSSILSPALVKSVKDLIGVELDQAAIDKVVKAVEGSIAGLTAAGETGPTPKVTPTPGPPTPAPMPLPVSGGKPSVGRFARGMNLSNMSLAGAAAVAIGTGIAATVPIALVGAPIMAAKAIMATRLRPADIRAAIPKMGTTFQGFKKKFFGDVDERIHGFYSEEPEEEAHEIPEITPPEPSAVSSGYGGAVKVGAVGGEAALASVLREAQIKQRVAQSRALPQMPSGGGRGGGAAEAFLGALPGMLGGAGAAAGASGAEDEEDEEEEEEEAEYEEEAAEQGAAAAQLQMRKLASKLMQQKIGMGEEQMREKLRTEIRKAATKAINQAIRNGVEWLANGTGVACDASSMGISFIITVIMYAVTLGDWNMQMIWGYYITKKQSILFPPLEWNPLPIPLPDVWLHYALVMLDVILVIAIMFVVVVLTVVLFGVQIATMGSLALLLAYFTDAGTRSFVNDIMGELINFF